LGIRICQKKFPKAKQIAIFDTAFHHTIKAEHFLYAIPHKYYKEDGIRKYGFHGTSHKYLRETYIKSEKNKKQTIITCHLGNGASVNLTKNGKSIENSL
jgi:acetate kinase